MKRRLINALGSVGYLFLIVQWLWMSLIVMLPIMTHPWLKKLYMPSEQPKNIIEVGQIPEALQFIIMISSIAFSIGVIIYAIFAVPKIVGKTGQKITRKVAKKTTKKIVGKQKVAKKYRRSLIERLTWGIKALLVAVPLVLLVVPPSDTLKLEHAVSIAFGLLLASVATTSFLCQFLLTKIWRIDSRIVW